MPKSRRRPKPVELKWLMGLIDSQRSSGAWEMDLVTWLADLPERGEAILQAAAQETIALIALRQAQANLESVRHAACAVVAGRWTTEECLAAAEKFPAWQWLTKRNEKRPARARKRKKT